MAKELKRKIYFYKVSTISTSTNNQPFNVIQAHDDIRNLPFSAPDQGRYLEDQNNNTAFLVIPSSSQNGRHYWRLGTVRRNDLPRLEQGGQVNPLSIAPDEGLLEETHCIFFPDGIVGAEFNFYGPRATRLERYLAVKCASLPRIKLNLLVQRKMADQIMRMRDIRMIRFQLRRDYRDLLNYASNSLPNAFDATDDQLTAL